MPYRWFVTNAVASASVFPRELSKDENNWDVIQEAPSVDMNTGALDTKPDEIFVICWCVQKVVLGL